MKKTIRNHIDTITTRRLAEGLILERRVTENGIDLRVMLQRPLEGRDLGRGGVEVRQIADQFHVSVTVPFTGTCSSPMLTLPVPPLIVSAVKSDTPGMLSSR